MGKIEGKKIAIVVANEFEDIELLYPFLRLSEEGAKIIVVPIRRGTHPRPVAEKPVTGRYGTPIPFEVLEEGKRYVIKDIEQMDPSEIDCLIFPGGYSPDQLRIIPKVLDFVREANKLGKIIAAICHGPQVLISADLIKGKKVTAYEAVKDDLINAGAEFVDEPAVRDGNIITARVPDDLPEFCSEIIDAISQK